MKKSLILVAVLALALLVSCGSKTASQSVTFKVETGDTIKVTLDTSDGQSLVQEDGEFNVSKGDSVLMRGIFSAKSISDITAEYAGTETVRQSDQEVVWVAGEEYDRALKITDKTCVLLASTEKADVCENLYKKLAFEVVDATESETEETPASETVEDQQPEEKTSEKTDSESTKADDTSDSSISSDDVDVEESIRQYHEAKKREATTPMTIDFHKITCTAPIGSIGREVSDQVFNVVNGESMVQFLYSDGTKDMTDGKRSAEAFANKQNATDISASDTTVGGVLAGTATYTLNGKTMKTYIFTVNKGIYAISSSDTGLLDEIVGSVSIQKGDN